MWYRILSVSKTDDYGHGHISPLTILAGNYGYGHRCSAYVPSDNSHYPGGNQVPVLEQYKDRHLLIYSLLSLYPGRNTYFISERRFPLLLQDLLSQQQDDFRYRIGPRLTILAGKYGYLVGGPQDNAYVPCNNSNDPGNSQVTGGVVRHNDGHIHIYSPVLLYPGLNTRIPIVRDGSNYGYRILSASDRDDFYVRNNFTVDALDRKNANISLMGHRTAPTCRATKATIPGVIRYPSWSSTRMVTYTYIQVYCCIQG